MKMKDKIKIILVITLIIANYLVVCAALTVPLLSSFWPSESPYILFYLTAGSFGVLGVIIEIAFWVLITCLIDFISKEK